MNVRLIVLLGMVVSLTIHFGCSRTSGDGALHESFLNTEPTREQLEIFEQALAAVSQGAEPLKGVSAALNPPDTWTIGSVTCVVVNQGEAGGEWAIFVETESGCPFYVHWSVKFGYNIVQGRVTVDLRASYRPTGEALGEDLAYELSGSGGFRFRSEGRETKVVGRYDLLGDIQLGGETYGIKLRNELDVREKNHGGFSAGQTLSSLSLQGREWTVGVRSVVDREDIINHEEHRLNTISITADRSLKLLEQLSVFSPSAISAIGREYVERRRSL